MLKSFKYEFIDELEYDYHGDTKIAEFIEVTAPNNKIKLYRSTIECAYGHASKESQFRLIGAMPQGLLDKYINNNNLNDAVDEAEQSTQDIVDLLTSNLDEKRINSVYDALEMILRESAIIDGHTPFGSALFNKMSFTDTKNLLGEYIKNFFVTSRQASKKTT